MFIALAGVQLGLLCLLGLNTSLSRGRHKVPGHFDPTDDKFKALYAAQRANGNQAEWGPAFAVMFIACHVLEAPTWILIVALWATVGRLALSYSLAFTDSLTKPTLMRRFGGVTTYLSGFILTAFLVCSGLL
jgi:uncharacterized membrane protein YecN with MAPEG domain